MTTPISICWTKTAMPIPEAGSIGGGAGSAGMIAIAAARPKPRRMRTGTARLENSGAAETMPSTRASGSISPAIQASSWAEVTSSI